MRHLAILVWLACAACAGSAEDGGNTPGDAGTSGDSNTCGNAITFNPFAPVADPVAPIRASVDIIGAPGVFTYDWSVTSSVSGNVSFTMEASDNSQIGFIAAAPGFYTVSVSIDGPVPNGCSFASGTVNVTDPGANVDNYRLRTVPPSGIAPPQETIIQVLGGGDTSRNIALDPGLNASGTVRNAANQGIAAYVKFIPVAAPNAFTELFSTNTGTFSTKLIGQNHDVLVIPTSTALAPKMLSWTATTPPQFSLSVGPGTLVNGTVIGPGGAGFANAKIQLSSGGVPSTVGTTAADGSFSLRADFPANAMITVKVTPPNASGLPRLEAIGQFNLAQSMQVTYATSLATCNLQNTPVRRAAANQPGAKVTIVASLSGVAGSVTTGTTTANALGTVRAAATANSSGQLPSILVPRAPLSVVVELGTNDFAVDTIDTSTCAAQTIDAAAMTIPTGTARNSANAALSGVRVEATPLGVLALADAQTVIATTAQDGTFSLPLAAGGRYDVRFVDPFARGARLELRNIAPAGVPGNAVLPNALRITGKVSVAGSTQPIPNASVQILCATCSGIEAARPVAETATDSLSDYRIAVPDPGTM